RYLPPRPTAFAPSTLWFSEPVREMGLPGWSLLRQRTPPSVLNVCSWSWLSPIIGYDSPHRINYICDIFKIYTRVYPSKPCRNSEEMKRNRAETQTTGRVNSDRGRRAP